MKKAVLVGLYIMFHLFVLREVRTSFFEVQTKYLVEEGISSIETISVNGLGARLIYLEYHADDFKKIWHYKFPFGFFFLLGMIGLILLGADKNFYLIIIGVHLIVTIMCTLIFSYLIYQNVWWLAVSDMLSRYFIPLSSIGIIPLSLLFKNELAHERKAS